MTKPTELGDAFRAWMDHLSWRETCLVCNKGATAGDDRYCAKGLQLRAAAKAELTAKPLPRPEKKPHHSVFNPAMERRA